MISIGKNSEKRKLNGILEWNFTPADTKIIKGIAILLMLAHHLWAFPDRLVDGELISIGSIFNCNLAEYIGEFGKICVSLFFFVGGYGIYISSLNKKVNILRRIKLLYISYWKVFLIFIPIAFIFFGNQENSRWNLYAVLNGKEFFENFFGVSSSYNNEWWFLISYVWVLLCFPIVKHFLDKGSTVENICFIIIGEIFLSCIFPDITKINLFKNLENNFFYKEIFCQTEYSACFWMGCEFARDNLLNKLRNEFENNKLLNPILDCIYIGVIIFLRTSVFGNDIDIIIVPVFVVVTIDLVKRLRHVPEILHRFGSQSTNMWLVHTFFCYYFAPVARVVVAPRLAFLSWVILVIISYIASIFVDVFWNVVKEIGIKINDK